MSPWSAAPVSFQRAQYPLNKEYTLNYRGLNIMIQGIFLNYGVLSSLGSLNGRVTTDTVFQPCHLEPHELCKEIAPV